MNGNYNWQESQDYDQLMQYNSQPVQGAEGSSILAMLGNEGYIATAHMMRDVPIKSPRMSPDEKELLDATCSGCHNLNRIFWTRGTHKTWDIILNEEQHVEIGLEPEDKKVLYKVFRNFPIKSPKMDSSHKKYLEDKCGNCHNLNRVFWSKGSQSTWESIMAQKQHVKLGLESRTKQRLYRIFQTLSN